MKLSILKGAYAVCRLSPDEVFPVWINKHTFWSVTKTQNELSIVCPQGSVPSEIANVETGWKAMVVEDRLDFSLTGVLASIASPLAAAEISIFTISTFDTDYVFVKEDKLAKAQQQLVLAGFTFSP